MAEVWKDIAEIRRINVRLMIDKHTGEELCRRLDITPQMLSQYVGRNPKRDFGETLARRIETEFKLPKNWLDSLHPEERSDVQMLMDVAQGLPPHRFTLLLQMAIALLNTNAAHSTKDSDDGGKTS